MKKVIKWLNGLCLTINFKKTNYVPFGCYIDSIPNINDIEINEEISIPRKNCIKYLGIYVDSHLKWNTQIETTTSKIRYVPFIMKKLKSFFDINTLIMIYNALFKSISNYGIVTWGEAYEYSKKSLQNLQKYTLKIIYNKPKIYPSIKLFQETSILPLEKAFKMRAILQLIKEKNYEFIKSRTRQASNFNVKLNRCKKQIS